MQKLAKIFLILATATLFFRFNVVWFFKLFEIFTIPALVFTVLSAKTQEERSSLVEFIKTNGAWLTIFLLALLFSLIGSLNGFMLYGFGSAQTILAVAGGYFYFAVSMITFLLVLYYGRDKAFRRKILLAFCSPIIFIPFIFTPALTQKFIPLNDGIHFQGTHDNPITFAFLCFFSAAVLTSCVLASKKPGKRLACWLLVVGLLSLIIWTGSRIAWLSSATAVSLIFIYLLRLEAEGFSNKKSAAFILAALFSVIISFAILPNAAKIMALDRVYPQISDHFPSFIKLNGMPLRDAIVKILANPLPSAPYQSRENLWPQAIKLFAKNPLGLGIEYFRLAKEIKQNGSPTHSHNTILQAGLVGGVGLLIVCVLAIWKIASALIKAPQRDFEWLTLAVMLSGSLFFSLVGEFLYIIPWIWIAAALAVAKSNYDSPKRTSQAS
jgi:hypothetical protein